MFFFIHFLTLKIRSDLQTFQEKHLKKDCTPFDIAVPKCYFSQYTSAVSPPPPGEVNIEPPVDVNIEPPESILVLEDMRTYGFKVS